MPRALTRMDLSGRFGPSLRAKVDQGISSGQGSANTTLGRAEALKRIADAFAGADLATGTALIGISANFIQVGNNSFLTSLLNLLRSKYAGTLSKITQLGNVLRKGTLETSIILPALISIAAGTAQQWNGQVFKSVLKMTTVGFGLLRNNTLARNSIIIRWTGPLVSKFRQATGPFLSGTRTSSDTQIKVRPRIYTINGINDPGGRAGTKLEAWLEQNSRGSKLTKWLENQNQSCLKPIEVVPINVFPAKEGGILTKGVNIMAGSTEVGAENVLGYGVETDRAYKLIMKNIDEDPLQKGQEVILIGHSGGGAIATNLTPYLVRRGVNVEGVVTVFSPVTDSAKAALLTKVVEITDTGDPFGQPLGRGDLSLYVAERLSKRIVTRETNSGLTGPAAHGSYTSTQVMDILKQEFPAEGHVSVKGYRNDQSTSAIAGDCAFA